MYANDFLGIVWVIGAITTLVRLGLVLPEGIATLDRADLSLPLPLALLVAAPSTSSVGVAPLEGKLMLPRVARTFRGLFEGNTMLVRAVLLLELPLELEGNAMLVLVALLLLLPVKLFEEPSISSESSFLASSMPSESLSDMET